MNDQACSARVLVVHNAYRQRGGEDMVCEGEVDLLRSHGHAVEIFHRHNDELMTSSRLRVAAETLWSVRSAAALKRLIGRFEPDVIHAHNTFPMISPSVLWTAARRGVPVVQTLHNFRLLCPQAMFLREGMVCELCIGQFPWSGIVHRCYRGSLPQTTVVAAMLAVHRALGTYRDKVTRFIVLNEFCRRKFIDGGLPAEKLMVKPNFVDSPAPSEGVRRGVLFVGRLSQEKGIDVLAGAMARSRGIDLRVAGSGPEVNRLRGIEGVTLLGHIGQSQIRVQMTHAVALVLPSICYESFPLTLVEAFASALPVVASRIGALAELVQDGVTGLLFEPGNADDLAKKMAWAIANPARMREMGCNARAEYEAKFSAGRNYQTLLEIYGAAMEEAKVRRA
jgi:glycosyltransferase involved in cell wall biosynthesis